MNYKQSRTGITTKSSLQTPPRTPQFQPKVTGTFAFLNDPLHETETT